MSVDITNLIGLHVVNLNTHEMGTIEYIKDGLVAVDFYGTIIKFSFPEAFSNTLEIEDEKIQEQLRLEGASSSFTVFKETIDLQFKKKLIISNQI